MEKKARPIEVEKCKVGAKGQVVIPARMRLRHKLKYSSQVAFVDFGDHIVLIPIGEDFFDTLPDRTSTGGDVWKEYLKFKKEEREKEKC